MSNRSIQDLLAAAPARLSWTFLWYARHRDRWLAAVASFSIVLWGLNFVSLQSVEYVISSQIAVSSQRLPMLQQLKQSCRSAQESHCVEKHGGVSFLDIQVQELPNASVQNAAEPELRSAHLRIRLANRSSFDEVEKVLEAITVPNRPSDNCVELSKKARWQAWQMEVAKHMSRRLDLDLEQFQIENSVVVDRSSNPFQLSAFVTNKSNKPTDIANLQDIVAKEQQQAEESCKSCNTMLEQLTSRSKGYLAFTGAPKMEPLVRDLSANRIVLLMGMTIGLWCMLMFALTFREQIAMPARVQRVVRKPKQKQVTTKSSVDDFDKTIRWLQSVGVPYLGAIQVARSASESPLQHPSVSNESQADIIQTNVDIGQVATPYRGSRSSNFRTFLQRCSDGSIVFWIVLFGVRVVMDAPWRELVVVSPLAAVSRILFGIV